MKHELEILVIGKKQTNSIKTLWENEMKFISSRPRNFKDHYKYFIWRKMWKVRTKLKTVTSELKWFIDNNKTVGYCISTIENTGEIDSLFIEQT